MRACGNYNPSHGTVKSCQPVSVAGELGRMPEPRGHEVLVPGNCFPTRAVLLHIQACGLTVRSEVPEEGGRSGCALQGTSKTQPSPSRNSRTVQAETKAISSEVWEAILGGLCRKSPERRPGPGPVRALVLPAPSPRPCRLSQVREAEIRGSYALRPACCFGNGRSCAP